MSETLFSGKTQPISHWNTRHRGDGHKYGVKAMHHAALCPLPDSWVGEATPSRHVLGSALQINFNGRVNNNLPIKLHLTHVITRRWVGRSKFCIHYLILIIVYVYFVFEKRQRNVFSSWLIILSTFDIQLIVKMIFTKWAMLRRGKKPPVSPLDSLWSSLGGTTGVSATFAVIVQATIFQETLTRRGSYADDVTLLVVLHPN